MPHERWIEDPRTRRRYQVLGEPLGGSEHFTLHACTPEGVTAPHILKVVAASEGNTLLDREAFLLRTMAEVAEELEAKNTGKHPYHYANFFPRLVASFIPVGQDGRRVSIVGFPEKIEELGQLVPVSAITQVDGVRLDPRSAAWIIGKSLKILHFAHTQGISVGLVTANNTLIERALHAVLFFDWTRATLHSDGRVSKDVIGQEIAQVARVGISALGGDVVTGTLIPHEQLVDGRFEALLQEMLQGRISVTYEAYSRFYDLIWELWPRGFHPFTTIPLFTGSTAEGV